ncbi:hypothetical protein PF005_g23252 [Phytophthora fragariae]|uniref:Integrase catalytic domain-containing protein n=1 Tax=Phytophthora fragariae TaxID=53985 RepID=A0A6A3WDV8_9STRA|nr:hypothetical protein PF003_g2963 [Phytophthora fragariae]KAE8924404.1 hypothetical protein PF009_g25362 [Phytophthora fragariae]KAE9082609.1 hypothetical protein PF007_g22230 [Phytophthora fragariae]KAE9104261.1 hypothetical protein PF006_g21952 [Phytophthora fragariae]KAE9180493.1 hypothetical protein PF005_g23252 [Phytophthora fragariae]
MLATSAGPIILRNLECFVDESDPSHGLIVGCPIMKILEYSTDELLVRARDGQTEWELAGTNDTTAPTAEGTMPLQRVCRLQAAMETSAPSVAASEDIERYETRTAFPTMAPEVLADLIRTLEQIFKVATAMGLVLEPRARLKAILRTRQDMFRLQFSDDPPVRVAPLQVSLKPGVTPTKSQPRRYSPDDRAFLERHVDALWQHSLVFRNPRSRWASAPRIVRKKEQDHDPLAGPRMTVYTRAENERTEAMPWPMPVLEVVIGELEGAHVFFVLDWFRGDCQLPLHPDSQEYFTFVTHRGMYTPTRVPTGATDAVAYCQGVVEEILGDLLGNGIMCWLGDILGYAADATALMELLDKVLARCEEYGLKLLAKKCQFFATEVMWCGKLISAQGVMHCPERVQGLIGIPLSRTAGELQQFICAITWMRRGIPEYNRLTGDLYAVLERAMILAGSRKKQKLNRFLLVDAGWSERDTACLNAVRDALLNMLPLAHPIPTAEVCLYADASQAYWGAVVTQIDPSKLQLPLEKQNHRPLDFLSGRFAGASSRWATIEMEAFASVESTRRLEYLLLRPRGYTDHRNLVYMFDPYGSDGTMARYRADKLQRWALSLMSFKYVIEHVPGEVNAWGNLLSLWGAGPVFPTESIARRVARLAVVDRVSPLKEFEFVWRSEGEIRTLQQDTQYQEQARAAGVNWDDERALLLSPNGQVLIPPDATVLQQRLCVIAHAGAGGHRGAKTTAAALSEVFVWATMPADVSTFVQGCLHYMVTSGGKIPRPHGETLVATKPNELLHFDFLSMLEGEDGSKYVFVLKDGMSGYVELVPCIDATNDQTYASLLDWFKRFGVVRLWVSDQGAHFKNQVIARLQSALGAHHHFTLSYTPWTNGTVKVVNREVLKSVKALLSERKLQTTYWPRVLPVVQVALNSMPSDRLDGATPLTAFTAFPGESQLRSILHPQDPLEASVTWVEAEITNHLQTVRAALDGMLAEMTSASEKRRRAARDRHAMKRGLRPQVQ